MIDGLGDVPFIGTFFLPLPLIEMHKQYCRNKFQQYCPISQYLVLIMVKQHFQPVKKPLAMKEFMLLFRQPDYDHSNTSPEEMQALRKKWQDWAGGIAAQGKMSTNGQRLAMEGKVLKAGGVITDGPFVEIRERL